MEVRDAAAGDWPAVAALLAELGRPDVRGKGEAAHRDAFLRYLDRPDTEALVAATGGRVVGFINVEYRERLNYDTPQAWVPELIVSEAERSKGAGGALLRRAEELAKQRGCWSFTLESANWRADAHRFYVREGLADAAKAFHKPLL
jgi:GNAT superfamily N-acetyltransferase